MGRRLRYQVAMSLDGFIAKPDGEYYWIVISLHPGFGRTRVSNGREWRAYPAPFND
jgi:hypothetical protein